ncbi:hypothetical protein EDD11_008638 [Mortierella claussenii]|nr:hypothetical protein EDD11_008638 [Mortierella claussenii]
MPTFHPLIKSPEKPTVLIVGAGLGGLTLAVLLERAEVPYQLFERATEAKPLGAALSLGGNVAPLFRQLGIFEEFVAISKVSLSNDGYSEERQHEYSVSLKAATEMGGCPYHFVTRAALHDLLLSKVPAEKIPLGKRVLSMRQNEHGVRIEFSDNSAVDGDILVGADGAYSGVRQSLYKQLKKDGKLSTSDDGALPFSCVCLVGTTKPLDPAQYPEFLLSYSRLHNVIGNNKPYSAL